MQKVAIIQKTSDYVRQLLDGEASGHDWWHTYRVWQMGKRIAAEEKADGFTVELACLLHDIADYKAHGGDEEIGPRKAQEWLGKFNMDPKDIDRVAEIIRDMSYMGPTVQESIKTLEGRIVQDADRLDAIGAIGIARVFATGAKYGRVLHDPDIKPRMDMGKEEYKDKSSPNCTSLNHFYEKLLLVKDRMSTKTAKAIATERHKYMEEYLERFFKEWEGKDLAG